MRPNFACDAPPTTITVGGFAYNIDVDYRTWIEVSRLLKGLVPTPQSEAQTAANLEKIFEIEKKVFGGILEDENPYTVAGECATFLQGYPSGNGGDSNGDSGADDGAAVVSFEQDINQIIIAIRNQSGIDLSYRRKEPFHWWEFLLEFQSLAGEHAIINLMQLRGYDGNDAKMLRAKRRVALKHEMSGAEQAMLDEVNALDYNA